MTSGRDHLPHAPAPGAGPAPPIIVIGTSEGGVEAIRFLCARLPADFRAAVFVVLHIGVHKSQLPLLLNGDGPLPAVHPRDGDAVRAGHVYVAPPDQHMVLERGRIRLTRGPRENWARPAVDPLFRSAARVYGRSVIGVVLTGGLNDGTAGLHEIKEAGGTTVVQEPDDCVNPSMARSALAHVAIDHRMPLADLPGLLIAFVANRPAGVPGIKPAYAGIAMTAEYKLDEPVAITCPDCGGALRRTELGSLTQFRCHIGHIYTAEVMVAAQLSAMEWSMEAAMRAMSERADLCRQMAAKTEADNQHEASSRWLQAMEEAKARGAVLRDLLDQGWMQPGDAEPLAPSGSRRHG